MDTNTTLIMALALMLFCCCSPVLLEPVLSETGLYGNGDQPMTKSDAGSNEVLDDAQLLHQAQTDHYIILMHHVEFKDSVYVQTLTDDDMVNLKITDEERAFSNDYVVSLNELYRQK